MRTHHIVPHNVDHYVILFLLVTIGLLALAKTAGQPVKQIQVAAVTSAFYCAWNLLHHYRREDLHWKIVVEYGAFALIGFIMLWVLVVFS